MRDDPDAGEVAGALRTSIGLLVRRLRQLKAEGELTLPESAVLARLDRGGATTATALAKLEQIADTLDRLAPDLIIISAGFDGHYRDPLGNLQLREEDFAWVTRKLMDVAEASAGGRIVSVLEGGYDLQGLQESVAAHVTALMGG